MVIASAAPLQAFATNLPAVERRATIPGGFVATGGVAGIKA
jgi:hypothetical protein